MKLENQVCSLEYAKKLKELVVKQESLWAYFYVAKTYENIKDKKIDESKYEIILIENEHDGFLGYKLIASAYTVAELGEMLPEYIRTNAGYLQLVTVKISKKWEVRYNLGQEMYKLFYNETEADARAKMLIYLLENKLISL